MQGMKTHMNLIDASSHWMVEDPRTVKLTAALRYLRKIGKYALDQPVHRHPQRTPILTKHVMDMHNKRRAA